MHIGAQAGMVMGQWSGGQALLIPLPLEDGKSLQKASKVVNKVLLRALRQRRQRWSPHHGRSHRAIDPSHRASGPEHVPRSAWSQQSAAGGGGIPASSVATDIRVGADCRQ